MKRFLKERRLTVNVKTSAHSRVGRSLTKSRSSSEEGRSGEHLGRLIWDGERETSEEEKKYLVLLHLTRISEYYALGYHNQLWLPVNARL